ncbi:MAG: DUF2705 family protein [Lachnospiraceae bacterium]
MRIKNDQIIYMAVLVIVELYVALSQPWSVADVSDGFFGLGYGDNIFFIMKTVFVSGIIIFSGYGQSSRYVKGYGVCQLTRTKKRGYVAGNVMLRQLIRAVKMSAVILTVHIIVSLLVKKVKFSAMDIFYTGMFVLVMYSILLWQSILELKMDERRSTIIVLCVFVFMLYLDGERAFNGISSKCMLALYVNMGFKGRMQEAVLEKPLAAAVVIAVIAVQCVILSAIMKKKDIL